MSADSAVKASPPGRDLAAGVRAGERGAVARAISTLESGGEAGAALLRSLRDDTGRARILGVTGAPGVGKSTLVGALIAELRRRGKSVGVIAVDPSSPLSGGAILGDRVRMTQHSGDDGVFIRSLASRGAGGGLSLAASRAADVLDAAGFDRVIIETVGAGQSEVDVADVADVTAVVCAPGLGDDIQAMKAGVLEIADVIIVNKADDPLAAVTANQLESMLALRRAARRSVPVLKTAARDGGGVPELGDVLEALFDEVGAEDRAERRRSRAQKLLAAAAANLVAGRIRSSTDARLDALVDEVASGERDVNDAAQKLMDGDARPGR